MRSDGSSCLVIVTIRRSGNAEFVSSVSYRIGGCMNRRSFLQRTAAAFAAAWASTVTGFDTFAKSHGLRNKQPFPVWQAKWKRFGHPGWYATTSMNIVEGTVPPPTRSYQGIPYDRFRYNTTKQEVVYMRKPSVRLFGTGPTAKVTTKADQAKDVSTVWVPQDLTCHVEVPTSWARHLADEIRTNPHALPPDVGGYALPLMFIGEDGMLPACEVV